ncbi:MAG: hypothetical protein AAFV29_26165, partial [Myxococcota bacterium]
IKPSINRIVGIDVLATLKGDFMKNNHTQTNRLGRQLGLILVTSVSASCGLGVLFSAPWITNADNNDVVFIGDSIFALSGDLQDSLYARNGGTFRNYTTSGAELEGGSLALSIR